MAIRRTDDPLTRFRAQDLDAAMADATRKQGVVTPMFDVIAPRYDLFTRLFSFGMDASWKRDLVDAIVARAPHATIALDVACGTGDLGLALARRLPELHVTGVDPSAEMLTIARARPVAASHQPVAFHLGEMAELPAAAASVDVISAGYGFRNVPDLQAAVRECARVLKPGGVLGSLDFFLPRNAAWRALFLQYLRTSGNVVGWWWHRTPSIYGYIARSIDAFVTVDQFSDLLRRNGFTVVETRRMLLGGIGLHVAIRNGAAWPR
ncbi:MAG TPA: ubiquinone/menaquinone biosynthesis methyltransferase [Gemmatimonadaceae bacterium]|nr:ubiquinone/menaquinone biosynthesis methyltransferase [Gemmatimonadaceae bacterium]